MTETKKSLFEGSPDLEARIYDVLTDPTIEYDEKRLDEFVKRAFVYKGSLDRAHKPSKENYGDFKDAVLATGLERAAYHHSKEEDYKRQIAELAFIIDGLYGLDYPELGHIYRDSLKSIPREGSFVVWRRAIGSVVSLVREDVELPNEQKKKKQDDTEELRRNVKPLPKKPNKDAYSTATQPNYSDPEDVVKYLFSAGIISSSHAKALIVTLGYQRPEGELSEPLKNDMERIRNELRARIAAYRQNSIMLEELGTRILESFIYKSATNPDLKLILDDVDAMHAVGRALNTIYRINDIQNNMQRTRQNKYGDMKVSVPIDEPDEREQVTSQAPVKKKSSGEVTKPKTYVSLEYTPQSFNEGMLDPDDEEHIRIVEMYTPIFGLGERELKAKFRAYIDPSPRNSDVDAYQQGIVDRIVDTINRELGGYEVIANQINSNEDRLLRLLLGIPGKSGEPTPKKSVSELAEGSESVQQTIYAMLRMIAVLVELKRQDSHN